MHVEKLKLRSDSPTEHHDDEGLAVVVVRFLSFVLSVLSHFSLCSFSLPFLKCYTFLARFPHLPLNLLATSLTFTSVLTQALEEHPEETERNSPPPPAAPAHMALRSLKRQLRASSSSHLISEQAAASKTAAVEKAEVRCGSAFAHCSLTCPDDFGWSSVGNEWLLSQVLARVVMVLDQLEAELEQVRLCLCRTVDASYVWLTLPSMSAHSSHSRD